MTVEATLELRERRRGWLLWAAAFVLAILWHVLGFSTRSLWMGDWTIAPPPPRMPVESFDRAKLDELRSKWKVLPPVLTKQPAVKDAPENARYMSDRNVRVEKEQRARRGNEGGNAKEAQPAVAPQRHYQLRNARLGNLGVPYRLQTRAPTPATEQKLVGAFAGEGAEQQLREDLPEGSENLLNTQNSIYFSFFERMREAVQPNWSSISRERIYGARVKLQAKEYLTKLEITLDREGTVIQIKLLESSGSDILDRAAEDSFWKVKRFQNPPQGLRDRHGRTVFPILFSFTVTEGAQFEYNYFHPYGQ